MLSARFSSWALTSPASKPGSGSTATTDWRVRARLRGRTLLELRPRTGRQHQLRVHLAKIGHPIVGDKLYLGGDELFLRSLEGPLGERDLERLGMERQALHAWRMDLEHPVTGKRLRIEAPLWPDLAAATETTSLTEEDLP